VGRRRQCVCFFMLVFFLVGLVWLRFFWGATQGTLVGTWMSIEDAIFTNPSEEILDFDNNVVMVVEVGAVNGIVVGLERYLLV
jgi:hypothetical protein